MRGKRGETEALALSQMENHVEPICCDRDVLSFIGSLDLFCCF